jgi:hypothetical protein
MNVSSDSMLHNETTLPSTSRFRVLVNGFADGKWFPTLRHAVSSVPVTGLEALSFEIYDSWARRFVWTRPRQRDSRSCPGAFSLQVNGYATGLTFASLIDAADFIAVRPPREACAVFENEICVFETTLFPEGFSQGPKLVEAL